MSNRFDRRAFLRLASLAPLVGSGYAFAQSPVKSAQEEFFEEMAEIEADFKGRIGVFAFDIETGRQLKYRAHERFAFCSTFKVMLVSALLKRYEANPAQLEQRITYTQADMVNYSPLTEQFLKEGLPISELCRAALQYSDNTAANLLIKLAGGPEAVTKFARSIGDEHFRLDRWETQLNSAIPHDERDTTTPEAMGLSLQKLTTGKVLSRPMSDQLNDWLLGNTTGDKRIRAAARMAKHTGMPPMKAIGDKTGTGDYGTANDIGVVWFEQRDPIILSVFTTQNSADAQPSDRYVVTAALVALGALASA